MKLNCWIHKWQNKVVTDLKELNKSLTDLIKLSDNLKNQETSIANEHKESKLQEAVNKTLKFSEEIEAFKFSLKEANELNQNLKMKLKESKNNEMQTEEKFTAQSEQWKTKMESADRKIDTLQMTNQDL